MSQQRYLLSPGPVNIPEEVYKAMATGPMHHRTKEFSDLLDKALSGVTKLFGTDDNVILLHSTGRGAMEACINNLLDRGDEVLCFCNGKFGTMAADIANSSGMLSHRLATSWEEDVDLVVAEQTLKDNDNIKAVITVHNDTSNGIVNPVEEIAKLAKTYSCLCIVDGVSSIGGIPFEFNKWGVDAAVVASQKCLMGPTGISFVALSSKAIEKQIEVELGHYYFDFGKCLQNLAKADPETPGSTPVALVAGIARSMELLRAEGIEAVFARHEKVANAVKNACLAMGCSLYPPNIKQRSNTTSCVTLPDGISTSNVKKIMLERFNIMISGGLTPETKNRIVRFGHMGYFYERDAYLLAACFESALQQAGADIKTGSALASLNRDFSKT